MITGMTLRVRCDQCGKKKSFSVDGDFRAEEAALKKKLVDQAKGWDRTVDKDLCPSCSSS